MQSCINSSLLFLVFVTILHVTAIGQTSIESVKAKGQNTIPFHLTAYNNIIIKAVLNSKDTVNLMLHTAASDVTLTEDAFAKLKTIKFTGTVDSVKSWGGGTNSSDFSKKIY